MILPRRYAISFVDDDRTWYIGRAASRGNPMRTRDPYCAMTWPSAEAAWAWVDELPDDSKAALIELPLSVVPVRAAVDKAVQTGRIVLVETMRDGLEKREFTREVASAKA